MTSSAAGASAQYMIEGPTDDGQCKLGMIYLRHPNSDWTYKPLHFVVDPEGNIETQLKKTVEGCLSEGPDAVAVCKGPLLEAVSGG